MSTTLRYRSGMRLSYIVALLLLMEHARETRGEFEYGPTDLAMLEDQGLTVCGPDPDLKLVQEVLANVPGLYLTPD